jgi:hypothetical protein
MMAGFADKEKLRDVDPDQPVDGAAGPQAAPESPSVVPAPDETLPARHVPGSSTPPSLLDLGATINSGATSPLVSDFWQNGSEGSKVSASATPQTNDLAAAHSGLLAELSTGQFSGAALGHVQAILSDITTAISAANASASGGAMPGAEQALRASHLSILNTVSTDPALANPVTEPVTKPEAAPADKEPAPADKVEATAPDANSAETAHLAKAADAADTAQTDQNLNAAIAEMQVLIAENPDLFVGLTVDDADEIVQQIQLELSHISRGDMPPGAAQNGSGDITAIVTGDINLASLTAQGVPSPLVQQAINIVSAGETQASPQVATIAIDDVAVTMETTEAPTIIVDHSQSGMPELTQHLHHTWG